MPAVRTSNLKVSVKEAMRPSVSTIVVNEDLGTIEFKGNDVLPQANNATSDLALLNKDNVYFPVSESERNLFRTDEGKKLSAHQWAVYDLTRQIPCGKVTTYKHVCSKLGEGSPRSVGSALRKNPFAPFVPCHRVIASDLSLGGFYGEWGTEREKGSQCSRKVEMLAQEGVRFTSTGKLENGTRALWN